MPASLLGMESVVVCLAREELVTISLPGCLVYLQLYETLRARCPDQHRHPAGRMGGIRQVGGRMGKDRDTDTCGS